MSTCFSRWDNPPLKRLLRLLDAAPDFFLHTGEPNTPASGKVDAADPPLSPPKPGKWQDLLKIATVAPLGKGTETIVDTTRRRCLQIPVEDAERENLIDARWEGLESALRQVESTLPFFPGTHLEAKPDKLLIYREGDFFLSHYDSKKDPSHILSLSVICDGDWKQASQGGEVVFDERPNKPSWSGDGGPGSFGCWYASEQHSVTPLTGSGFRVVLTYIVTATQALDSGDVKKEASSASIGDNEKQSAASSKKKDHVNLAMKKWINQPLSTLSQLPLGVANEMVAFLDSKSEVQLARTCRDLRGALALHTKEGAIRVLATALRNCNEAVNERDGETSFETLLAPTVGFLLQHRYAFDSIELCHLKGKDAILGAALLHTFPNLKIRIAKCVLRQEKKQEWDSYYDFSFGVYQEKTETFAALDGGGTQPVLVPEKYRHLLPPGKTSIARDVAWRLTSSFMENDERLYTVSWPFFGGVRFVFSADAAQQFVERQGLLDAEFSLWGNEGHFDIAWYKGGALLLEGINASRSVSGSSVVQADDCYPPLWWAFKDLDRVYPWQGRR